MNRYLLPYLIEDLKRKMVFMGGPRQVGKTTLTQEVRNTAFKNNSEYFNWDGNEHKKIILKKQWLSKTDLVVFDELHKYSRWKQWIKGVYDLKPEHQQYLVTGSARLDVYRRGGDSLLGRYHYWRLHPLTLDELPKEVSTAEGYERLLNVGGFPEPFFRNDARDARRWRLERFDRILFEDVRDLELIRELEILGLFVDALRERAGGLVTLSNIAEELQISPVTAKKWLLLVERLYMVFSIRPFTKNVRRAIQKPPKVYFYDNADVTATHGARLENLVATHLLKRLHFIEDYFGYRTRLHYLRDKDGREVDFVTVIDNKIHELIEVKESDTAPSTALQYYAASLKPKRAVQIVGNLQRPFDHKNIHVTSPIHYFVNPPWITKKIE